MIELRRGCILHVHDGTALFMGGYLISKIGKDNKQVIFSNVIIELALYLYLYLAKRLQNISVKLEGIKVPSGTDIHAVLCDLSSSVCFAGFVSGGCFYLLTWPKWQRWATSSAFASNYQNRRWSPQLKQIALTTGVLQPGAEPLCGDFFKSHQHYI